MGLEADVIRRHLYGVAKLDVRLSQICPQEPECLANSSLTPLPGSVALVVAGATNMAEFFCHSYRPDREISTGVPCGVSCLLRRNRVDRTIPYA
jgi:hypothetical protein